MASYEAKQASLRQNMASRCEHDAHDGTQDDPRCPHKGQEASNGVPKVFKMPRDDAKMSLSGATNSTNLHHI